MRLHINEIDAVVWYEKGSVSGQLCQLWCSFIHRAITSRSVEFYDPLLELLLVRGMYASKSYLPLYSTCVWEDLMVPVTHQSVAYEMPSRKKDTE